MAYSGTGDKYENLQEVRNKRNMIMKADLLKGLSAEQIAKVKEMNSVSDILHFAKEEGVELTDEQLQAISGGGGCFDDGTYNVRDVVTRQ